jgi:cell division initiation protein
MLTREDTDRSSRVTPIDMRQARFATSMRGFDKPEVTSFLESAASDYEQALLENQRLRQQITTLEASLTQHRELESSLKSTLISAQKVADDLRETAQQEAVRIVREAEGKAELLMQKAQARVEDVVRDIDGLKLKRREIQTNIESAISALQNTLNFVEEQEQRERDNRFLNQTPAAQDMRAVPPSRPSVGAAMPPSAASAATASAPSPSSFSAPVPSAPTRFGALGQGTDPS